ncbi:MAG: citrate synthase [Spirochaetes bacterium]|jgi:citrate synthase|nr:citrate synthase [Spirochaetota bacterium]
MSEHSVQFLDTHAPLAQNQNIISPEEHKRYKTKRGLRNEDGTGVLIGLTEIGDVHGYIIDELEKIPVEGRLTYRGVDVSDIVDGFQQDGRFGFEEVAYLLLFGELPSETELSDFRAVLGAGRTLPNGFTEDMILRAPSSDIMNKLARSVLAAYSYDDNAEDTSVRNVLRQVVDLIARFPTLVAYGYQAKRHYYHNESLYIHSPEPELSTAENLLQLVRPHRDYTKLEAETLDLALVLHAEHGGGNNSSFSVHVVSSAATDTYSAIATACGSLKGPKHGGASGRVATMMEAVMNGVGKWDDEEEIGNYLTRIAKKETGDGTGLIYGMGHAVYTLSDPRAVLLKEKARELAAAKGYTEQLALYERVEELTPGVLREVRGRTEPISANVDFYSGLVYEMLNIPRDLYVPIFAVSRVAGWSAHLIEEIVSGGRIMRPAYKNILGRRDYVPMNERR